MKTPFYLFYTRICSGSVFSKRFSSLPNTLRLLNAGWEAEDPLKGVLMPFPWERDQPQRWGGRQR